MQFVIAQKEHTAHRIAYFHVWNEQMICFIPSHNDWLGRERGTNKKKPDDF